MQRNFMQAMQHRRSYYSLTAASPVSDDEIRRIVGHALLHAPSAFNSQSSRAVLLFGEEHRRLWDIVLDTLRPRVRPDAFPRTQEKIEGSFASGHGTVLFYEDDDTVHGLRQRFPAYADAMPVYSQHASAILQFSVWTMLEECGLGASLQHYNPLIDARVAEAWNLPPQWRLVAQMPFGTPAAPPQPKEFMPLDERMLSFGA